MIKNNKKALLFTTALLGLSLFLGTGCSNKNAQNPPANNTDTAKEKIQDSKAKINDTSQNLTDRAQKIADEVIKIDGIDKARVAISEKRALVGVSIPNNAEGKLTDELKKKVKDTVKNTDKEIDTVAVSADADIYERISKIGDGIKEGKGIEEFADEFKELFNRIIPQ
ncbi:YhcN/YlaJ family sporulation lipoprotein [Clostridium tepidum]|uniref:YhcN/YlaJ family sporulation lipoprotein n=1 Tax=Clostridium tepidum TaxID=1962263 RepID=UPI00214A7C29|nr:YhcN/YlaJ family sporulation lipoprotein [Clostridium tepidum]MCR1935176.1 YhcN/YlaJ family sporulation lipoprotein [Clostridium tepidum]